MKGTTMKVYKLIWFITLMLITVSSAVYAADVNDNNAVNKEKNLPFEQRMQKKISVDFRNTPIDDVLRIMADQSGVDIIKSPKVIGNVTATLTNIPLDEALTNILATQGYGYVPSSNMLRVLPREEIGEASERLVTETYQINYANVSEMESALKKFLSPRGSISSLISTSNIIVTDCESKMKAIHKFIAEGDHETPQIEVEARIYDITSKDSMDLGVEWSVGRNTTFPTSVGTDGLPVYGAGVTAVGVNPTTNVDPFTNRQINPFTTGTFTGNTGETTGTTGALRFGWLTPALDIDALLRAQKQNIDAKLLANPRILVLDNQKADIKITTEIPYQQVTDTSAGGSMGSTAFKEVGVTLTVTPHLTRNGMVRLQLKPEFSVQTGSQTVANSTTTFSVPVIDRREADTMLLVENGHTIVLGGLRKKDTTKQINKIPFLGDMPVVGAAFRFQGENSTISELVVFITPRIIDNPVLTPTELQQLKVTDFNGPPPVYTSAEKPTAKKVAKKK
jgi:type IV pilus assembly protein PilQ